MVGPFRPLVLSLLSLISRNSPKQLGMVSPELSLPPEIRAEVLGLIRSCLPTESNETMIKKRQPLNLGAVP